MAKNKKYYWLKLKDNFFSTREVKKLRKVAGGDTYTIIYLKMKLLSIKNEGVLIYEKTEESLAEQLALELDEEEDNIKITLSFLQANNLIEQLSEDEYFLNRVPEAIGNETDAAERMRRLRAKRNNVTHELRSVTQKCNNVQNCYTEIEKDLDLEKEREIEKELERDITPKEKESTSKDEMISKPKTDYQKFVNYWNSVCMDLPKVIKLTKNRKQTIRLRLNEFGEDEILRAIDETASSDFLCGKVNGFMASFDWILKTANLTKILEGNYKNKKSQSNYENQKSSNPFLNLLQSGELSNDEVNTIF